MNDIQTKFFETLNKMEQVDECFLNTDLTALNFCLELSYSRSAFVRDISNVLKTFSSEQQKDITLPFNFVVENGFLNGCPTVNNNGNKIINECVKNFVINNKVLIKNNVELAICIDSLTKMLPEFLALIGKVQHHTHDYTVDVHTLKVLQGVMSDDRFCLLNDCDKKVLEIAILLHDLTKREGEIDKSHPECSANFTEEILKRIDINNNLKNQIVLIIRQHDWLERYNKGITSAVEFAKLLKDGNNFLMECILAKADLKAVQRSGFFYEKFKEVLLQGEKEISALIDKGLSVA